MTAREIIKQWYGMSGEAQYNFCQNSVKRAISQGRKLKAGYDFDDATHSTFEGVLMMLANLDKLESDCKRRERQSRAENTLAAVVCRAANNTMESISYHADKDNKATSQTITDEDGNEIDYLDTVATADDTEDSGIIRVTLQQFMNGLDEINQKILAGRIEGKTEREISETVLISNVAVHKRIVKIQTALAAILK